MSRHPSLAFPQLIMYVLLSTESYIYASKNYRYGEMECTIAANETTTLFEKGKVADLWQAFELR